MWRGVGRICGRDFGGNSNGLLGPDRMVSPFAPSLVDPCGVPVVAREFAGSCSMEKHFIGTGVGCPEPQRGCPGSFKPWVELLPDAVFSEGGCIKKP